MPRIKERHISGGKPYIRKNVKVARMRAKQRVERRGPLGGVKPNDKLYHGSPKRLKKGETLKPDKKSTYKYGKDGVPTGHQSALFLSHDKTHAARFAAGKDRIADHRRAKRSDRGTLYSTKRKNIKKMQTEKGKPFKDSQYTRQRVKPTHAQQVRAKPDGSLVYGHKWKHDSGNLPKHTRIQQRSLDKNPRSKAKPRTHASRKFNGRQPRKQGKLK